jgi:ferredoxin
MIECPTGAIGRGADGEVFIREELCTGCGACAKACPWDNIRMTARPPNDGNRAVGVDVAVKCDLCRGYTESACVEACPTGAVLRVEPGAMFSELRAVLRAEHKPAGATDVAAVDVGREVSRKRELRSIAALVCLIALTAIVAWAHDIAFPDSGRGVALLTGWIAALATLCSASYALVKRGVRYWIRKARAEPLLQVAGGKTQSLARASRTRGWLRAHIGFGVAASLGASAHAGFAIPSGSTGMLAVSFWVVSLSGLLGSLLYGVVPRRLTRLERSGLLPEDFGIEQERLAERLHASMSQQNALVKTLAERVLGPYAKSWLGAFALAFSGRSLREERLRVRARIDRMLQGRGTDKLVELDPSIGVVVEIRALGVRRATTTLLRAWLVVHVIGSAVVCLLLLLHVIARIR